VKDKCSFKDAQCMEEKAIPGVASHMCSRSNDDCKAYFKTIGIE
jgi:hypothetical protein